MFCFYIVFGVFEYLLLYSNIIYCFELIELKIEKFIYLYGFLLVSSKSRVFCLKVINIEEL